jgi:DNA-binding MarR family transcriptional regulator
MKLDGPGIGQQARSDAEVLHLENNRSPGQAAPRLDDDSEALLAQLRETNARLSAVIEQLAPGAVSPAVPKDAPSGEALSPAEVKRLLQLRAKRRRNAFGQFLDWPAWDMLLDLAAVKAEGGHVSVSAVCISSGAPQSTALRKLAALESANLVRRYLHGADRRRVCLTLTDEAMALVNALLAEEAQFFAERPFSPAARPAAARETVK